MDTHAIRLRAHLHTFIRWALDAKPDSVPLPNQVMRALVAFEADVVGDNPFVEAPYMPVSTGYPDSPFLNLLADRLVAWRFEAFPISLLPMEGYVEVASPSDVLLPLQAAVFPLVDGLIDVEPTHTTPVPLPTDDAPPISPPGASPTEDDGAALPASAAGAGGEAAPPCGAPPQAAELLQALGLPGIACLLGLRTTVGSVRDRLPPTRTQLLNVFTTPFKAKARLTTGARAWTKHAHRSSESFWGDVKGTEPEKNDAAFDVISVLLNDATWINCHTLPHDQWVVELRIEAGYGARWSIDHDGSSPPSFRGFLEPYMADGHEKGWRH